MMGDWRPSASGRRVHYASQFVALCGTPVEANQTPRSRMYYRCARCLKIQDLQNQREVRGQAEGRA